MPYYRISKFDAVLRVATPARQRRVYRPEKASFKWKASKCMSETAQREWTQSNIVEATRDLHSGEGFFDTLGEVCEAAFGGALGYDPGDWQFPMNALTIGQLLDFFGGHGAMPVVCWHNECGGPTCYVVIDNLPLAEAFRARFETDWLTRDQERDRADEDMLRAGGWRP
jgi:hypothetical protein